MSKEFIAYCNSSRCSTGHYISSNGVKKEVPKGTINCKDCGSVITWVKNGKARWRTNVKSTGRKSYLPDEAGVAL